MTRPRIFALASALAALGLGAGGCTNVVSLGAVGSSACGPSTCAEGQYCCNESCGICAPIGGSCTTMVCGASCDPQDIHGITCIAPSDALGYAWNGADCVLVSGCECRGADCASLFATMGECVAAYTDCMPVSSGCLSYADCAADEYCAFPDGQCGLGSPGICTPRPMCAGAVGSAVCGCDGTTYPTECAAHAAGEEVVLPGPC